MKKAPERSFRGFSVDSLAAALVKSRVTGVEISGLKLILYVPKGLAKALIVDNLPLTKKPDRFQNIRVIHQPNNVVIGGPSLLFGRHIFMKIGNGIAFGLKVFRTERCSG